jgi:superfamily II DNA/RNA helicase
LSLHAASDADAATTADTGTEAAPAARTTFRDLGLSELLLRAIEEKGYLHPTPIQEQAIPIVLQGRDVLGCAQTGTGKTASFTLPMMEILSGSRARARMPRSLILEPTRELALQVAENFVQYGKHLKLNHALLIGGESMADQKNALMRGVDVLIATPGRLIDLFERGGLLLSDARILVIDEADRMLDMGFIPDVERIVAMLPANRQTLFFSATIAPPIRRLADAFLQNPKEITTSASASVAPTIVAGLAVVAEEDKRRTLRKLIETQDVTNALIFSNRKRDVDILYKSLQRHGFSVGSLHGDMVQSARFTTLEKFRANEIRLLVCSDVAARGIDIGGLSHVFNFDVPHHAEDYVHRIGRTGRAGLTGHAFTLATPDEREMVDAIEKLTGAPIPRIDIEGVSPLDWAEGSGDRRGRGRGRGGEKGKPAEKGRGERGRGRGAQKHEAPTPIAAAEVAVPDFVPQDLPAFADAAPLPEQPRRSDGKPPRPEGATRGKPHRERMAREVQAIEDAAALAEAPQPQSSAQPSPQSQPREDRKRGQRRPAEAAPVEARIETARAEAPRAEGGRNQGHRRDAGRKPAAAQPAEQRESNAPVLGFGADVPAFMLIRPRRRAAEATPVEAFDGQASQSGHPATAAP